MKEIRMRLTVRGNSTDNILRLFKKTIESNFTPSCKMLFSGRDYTLNVERIYFSLDDGSLDIYFREYVSKNEKGSYDFLIQSGWELIK